MVHPVLFFFGAGASVAAGIPPTEPMVEKFLDSIRGNKLAHRTLTSIVSRLAKWSKSSPGRPATDIELLLEVLGKLQRPEDDPVTLFYSGGKYDLADDYPKSNLIQNLRDFMKAICLVGSGHADYLRPLRQFLVESKPIRIFTVKL